MPKLTKDPLDTQTTVVQMYYLFIYLFVYSFILFLRRLFLGHQSLVQQHPLVWYFGNLLGSQSECRLCC